MSRPEKKVKLSVRVAKQGNKKKEPQERLTGDGEFIEDFDEKVDHYVQEYVEKTEKHKLLTLFSGVSFFMLLIFSLYFYNLKLDIKNTFQGDNGLSEIGLQMESVKSGFSDMLDGYQEIKSDIEKASQPPTAEKKESETTPLPPDREQGLKESDIKKLKEELNNKALE